MGCLTSRQNHEKLYNEPNIMIKVKRTAGQPKQPGQLGNPYLDT